MYIYRSSVPFSELPDGNLSCDRCKFVCSREKWKFFSAHLKFQHVQDAVHSRMEKTGVKKQGPKDRGNYYGIRIITKGKDHHKCGACSLDFKGKSSLHNCRRHLFGVHLGMSFISFTEFLHYKFAEKSEPFSFPIIVFRFTELVRKCFKTR